MGDNHKDLFLAVYHTAQRPGRIYSLQWKQIDVEGRSITFENTSRNKRVPNVLWINDTLLEILSRLKSDRRTLSPYVFYKPSLKPYSEFDALKIWKNACEKSNVEGTIPRDLRHKAITDMKRAGFNDSFVGNVVGHSDPRTTNLMSTSEFNVSSGRSYAGYILIKSSDVKNSQRTTFDHDRLVNFVSKRDLLFYSTPVLKGGYYLYTGVGDKCFRLIYTDSDIYYILEQSDNDNILRGVNKSEIVQMELR